ncbi:MAG TPA: hypothetical protein VNO84_13720 [Burkholderiaceae bacterium]|nr:hypothetical protein [Burkholderiaceae bacterium]
MWSWIVGLKLAGLVAFVLALIGVALDQAAAELLLVLAVVPAAAAVSSGIAAFLDLDR